MKSFVEYFHKDKWVTVQYNMNMSELFKNQMLSTKVMYLGTTYVEKFPIHYQS